MNSVEEAIIYGSRLGFDYFEFMSTYNDIPDKDLINWINICKRNNLKILYEHHPEKNWSSKNNNFTNSDKIISMLKIFFENDAEKLVLDHDEFELQSNHEVNNYDEIISSDKGLTKWLEQLHIYGFSLVKKAPTKKNSAFKILNKINKGFVNCFK